MNNKIDDYIFAVPHVFGGWAKDQEIRKNSSSGGIFTLLANAVLDKDGTVYGCTLDSQMHSVHVGIRKKKSLSCLKGSKYVQSSMNNSYTEIKKKLENEEHVLFVGTPCQAAGLKSFLNKNYPQLYICDFICHGVPSPGVFLDYVSYLEKKYGEKIIDFRFRNKDRSWSQTGQQMGTRIRFSSGKIKKFMPAYKDAFMNGFLSDLYLRPSCYSCHFKVIPKKYSDITIADFWGVRNVAEDLDGTGGTSLILLNNEKGMELFKEISDNFYGKECDYENSIKKNKSLVQSMPMPIKRDSFFEAWKKNGFKKIKKKYLTFFHMVIFYLGKRIEG